MSKDKSGPQHQLTRGPWRIVRNVANRHDPLGSISIVGEKDGDGWSSKVALVNFRNEANARLIAAAPELYETLKALIDALPSSEEMAARGKAEGPMLVQARAAIAKAEGRS